MDGSSLQFAVFSSSGLALDNQDAYRPSSTGQFLLTFGVKAPPGNSKEMTGGKESDIYNIIYRIHMYM